LKKSSGVSPTEAGRNKSLTSKEARAGTEFSAPPGIEKGKPRVASAEQVDAINQLFRDFELVYHNQFRKAYPDEESIILAKKYWLASLGAYSPAQLSAASRQIVRSEEYLPSIATVVKACETGIELFGLPAVRQAYLEACCAPSPKAAQQWSHEAVYLAGRASDWFVLANEPESVALPIFAYHYQQLCRRVVQGEQLDIVQAPALEQQAARKLSAKENRKQMQKLRKSLGI
jgi:hypothetical protein